VNTGTGTGSFMLFSLKTYLSLELYNRSEVKTFHVGRMMLIAFSFQSLDAFIDGFGSLLSPFTAST